MPKLEYPSLFDGNLIGVKCKEEIAHHEAFLYVPLSITISVNGTKNHDILGPIINENPEIFDEDFEDVCADWEQLTLTLALLYEFIKGRSSFWYPYLRIIPEVDFISNWSSDTLELLHDMSFLNEILELKQDVKDNFSPFFKMLKKYPKIFPEIFV